MSFSGRTPESLLPRSDSKNPATTCKGITTNGRPCRRALASNSPAPSPSRGNGVLAVLYENDAAAFYCWQHKDQAENLAQQPEQHTTLYPLKERSSIDTLVSRIGIIDLDEKVPPPKRIHHKSRKSGGENSATRRDNLPTGWHDMQSPLMTVPEEVKQNRPSRNPSKSQYAQGRSNVKFSWTCCLRVDDDEETRPPRRTAHAQQNHQNYNQRPQMTYQSLLPSSSTLMRQKPMPPSTNGVSSRLPASVTADSNQPTSQTQTLLSLIPQTLSAQITSSLLAELSRPISPHDEAGYIYIFWLTPESDTSPDDETASSLLDDEDLYSPTLITRRDTAIQRYASTRRPSPSCTLSQPKRTIMLKIGRAQNVHRRMTQWSKQCGQNITLIRYYPHTSRPSTYKNTVSPLTQAKKVPNAARVERLIHLELSDNKALKDKCEQCGREHREWFEVEASRDGLERVDEVVRRWVGWGQQQQQRQQQQQLETSGDGVGIAVADVRVSTRPVGQRSDRARQLDQMERERERESRIHVQAWQNADRIRDEAWRDTGTTTSRVVDCMIVGNDRGGYY